MVEILGNCPALQGTDLYRNNGRRASALATHRGAVGRDCKVRGYPSFKSEWWKQKGIIKQKFFEKLSVVNRSP